MSLYKEEEEEEEELKQVVSSYIDDFEGASENHVSTPSRCSDAVLTMPWGLGVGGALSAGLGGRVAEVADPDS